MNEHLTCGSLATTGCQHERLGRHSPDALRIGERQGTAAVAALRVEHKRAHRHVNAQRTHRLCVSRSVLGAGKCLAIALQAKAVVHALLENAAQLSLALNNEDLRATRVRGYGRGKPRGATTNNQHVIGVVHASNTSPATRSASSACANACSSVSAPVTKPWLAMRQPSKARITLLTFLAKAAEPLTA